MTSPPSTDGYAQSEPPTVRRIWQLLAAESAIRNPSETQARRTTCHDLVGDTTAAHIPVAAAIDGSGSPQVLLATVSDGTAPGLTGPVPENRSARSSAW
jgi:hypothetical protein